MSDEYDSIMDVANEIADLRRDLKTIFTFFLKALVALQSDKSVRLVLEEWQNTK